MKSRLAFETLLVGAVGAAVLIGLLELPRLSAQSSGQQSLCYNHDLSFAVLAPNDKFLRPSDFDASVGKQRAEVQAVHQDASTRRFAIVVDSSGSVLSSPFVWQSYLGLASEFVKAMPGGSVASVATFADAMVVVTPFTEDRTALEKGVELLGTVRPKGLRDTAIWDALAQTSDSFGTTNGGDTIILFTDGVDDASRIKENDTLQSIRSKGLTVVVISTEVPRPGEAAIPQFETKYLASLQKSVIESGGAAIEILPKRRIFSYSSAKAGALFGHQFELSFLRADIQLPQTRFGRTDATARITDHNEGDYEIDYMIGLAQCSAT